jgi:2-succinyl-5-enolpyruvyl-6-hydroxy-3-cyclohexene-1-carboxylate synthase
MSRSSSASGSGSGMSRSSSAGPSVALARVWVDELVRCGLTDLCLAPGSRSAPLVMAAAADGRIRLHVRIDERSAAFLALGLARGSGRPAAMVCTSGTAAANVFPAVVEADRGRVPLIVLTADRPPELRHTAANQTIDQVKLYGDVVRWFCEVGVAEDDASAVRYWRSTVCRAWSEAVGVGAAPGPVHCNVAFREPLVPNVGTSFSHRLDGRDGGRPWTTVARRPRLPAGADVDEVADAVAATPRGVLVIGDGAGDGSALLDLAAAAGWPVLAEAHTGCRRGPNAVGSVDLLLRHETFAHSHRPELVLTVGRLGLSKALLGWMDDVPHVLVDPDGAHVDPRRSVDRIVAADPQLLAGEVVTRLPHTPARATTWLDDWLAADRRVMAAVAAVLDRAPGLTEPVVARELAAAMPDGAVCTVASSMPIRDLDTFMVPRAGVRFVANRGASGIDGFVSTAVGVALAHEGPAYALAGDLSLLHDQNGLLIAHGEPRPDLVIVVSNNDGGGIFSFLPQADHPDGFERVFGTPHGVDLGLVAAAARCGYRRAESRGSLRAHLDAAAADGGVQLVEVRTERTANRALHAELVAAAGAAIDGRR